MPRTKKIPATEFGRRFREWREGLKLTQAQLATNIGTSYHTVLRLEHQNRDTDIETLRKLRAVYPDAPVPDESLLSDSSTTMPHVGIAGAARGSSKMYPETEIVARLMQSITDDTEREAAMDDIRALIRKRHSPRKAGQE